MKNRLLSAGSVAALLLAAGCGLVNNGSAAQPAEQSADAPAEQGAPSIPAEALKAAVGDSKALNSFYEARQWQAAWSPQAVEAFRSVLDQRTAHGLDRMAPPSIADSADAAEHEISLTRAALIYASALGRGISEPKSLYSTYTLPRPNPDLIRGLSKALAEEKIPEFYAALAPQSDEYKRLSQAYLEWRRQVQSGQGEGDIASGDAIHAGDADPRVPDIASALRSAGYLSSAGAVPSGDTADTGASQGVDGEAARFTPEMETALKRMQADFGIKQDGVVGPDTLEVLNMGGQERMRALAVAMERMRWMERNPPETRIDVNTASAMLEFMRDGSVVDRRRVIVGEPDKETPQIQAPFFRLVANPTWTVPRSIQQSELAGVSQAYLRRNNMEMRDGWIVQKAGPKNSLGLVKFDMQNPFAIYLHDTPAKQLFERNQRQFSHGCVRVQDALAFAQMIAQQEGITDQWEKARSGGEQSFVPLPRQIPVRLYYRTAFVDADGQLRFRTDPYGWDDAIAEKIGFGAHGHNTFRSDVEDLGP